MSVPASTPETRKNNPALRTDYIQPTLGHALRIWWAFYWRTTAVSIVLVAIATVALRSMYQRGLISAYVVNWGLKVVPYVFYYAAAIPVLRFVLHKTFKHFRVAIWSQGTQPPSTPEKPTYGRVIRVWWAFSWRAAVYSFVATVLAGFPLRFIAAFLATSPKMSAFLEMLLGFIVGAAMALFVIYSNILDEDMADFHVGLLAVETPEPISAEIAQSTATPS